MWFLEHAQMTVSFRPTIGRVPRYLSWLNTISYNFQRRGFNKALKKHNVALVNEGTLEPSNKEKKMIEKGLQASNFLFIICNEEEMNKRSEKSIYELLLEMVPIYMKFGVKPCEFLVEKFELGISNYVYVDEDIPLRNFLSSEEIQSMIVEFSKDASLKASSQWLSQNKSPQKSRVSLKKKYEIKPSKMSVINYCYFFL